MTGDDTGPPPLPPPPFWRTVYYEAVASRKPDRAMITVAQIRRTVADPTSTRVQNNGRYALHRYEPGLRHWLWVILLADGKTVHNAYPNRSFKP